MRRGTRTRMFVLGLVASGPGTGCGDDGAATSQGTDGTGSTGATSGTDSATSTSGGPTTTAATTSGTGSSSTSSDGTTSGSGSTGSGGATDGTSTGTAGGSTGGLQPIPNYGYVRVRLTLADDAPADLLDGLWEAELHLDNSDCVKQFYWDYPQMNPGGLDGGKIWAAFKDPSHPNYLCGQDDPNLDEIDCDIVEAWKYTDAIHARYAINDINTVDGGILFMGPLPCMAITTCEPIVTVTMNGATFEGWEGRFMLPSVESLYSTQPESSCDSETVIELVIGEPP